MNSNEMRILHFDPWRSAPEHETSGNQKKMARLAGKHAQSGKVHVLIKLHDWSGRAIYIYNLTIAESEPSEKRMRHISQPSDEVWKQYRELGVEIPHPGKIQATDVTRWVRYGKQEAHRLGLKVEE